MSDFIPDFPPVDGLNNAVDDVLSTTIYSDSYVEYFYGKIGNYIFATSEASSLLRRNFQTEEDDEILITTIIYSEYQMRSYIPLTESTGILIVDGHDGSSWISKIQVYDVNWTALTCTFRSEYDYNWMTDFDSLSFAGCVKTDEYVGCMIAMQYYDGRDLGYFLIYREDTDTFSLLNGPDNGYDSYYFNRFYYPKDYTDVGNGIMAYSIDMGDIPTNKTNSNSYVSFINFSSGSVTNFAFPRDVAKPPVAGNYCYDIVDYFDIAPSFQDHSAYVQTVYKVYSGTAWVSYTRILKITSSGTMSVVATFDFKTPYDYYHSYGLSASDNKVVSYRYDSGSIIYYNATTASSMFSKSYFNATVVSRQIDDVDGQIPILKYTSGSIVVNKISDAGDEQLLVDVGSIYGVPTFTNVPWMRLTENVLIYQTVIFGTKHHRTVPCLVHYTPSVVSGNYFRAVMW